MSSYPKWLYHRSEPARIVEDQVEHLALGDGWVESPADVDASALEQDEAPKSTGKPKGKPKPTVN